MPRCPEAVSREEVILGVGREMMGEVLYKGDREGSRWTTVTGAPRVGQSLHPPGQRLPSRQGHNRQGGKGELKDLEGKQADLLGPRLPGKPS